jgi:hypothetical protein
LVVIDLALTRPDDIEEIKIDVSMPSHSLTPVKIFVIPLQELTDWNNMKVGVASGVASKNMFRGLKEEQRTRESMGGIFICRVLW